MKNIKTFFYSGRGKCSLIHWATTKEKRLETLQSKFVHVDWFLLKLPAVAFLESSDQCHSEFEFIAAEEKVSPTRPILGPFFALLKKNPKRDFVSYSRRPPGQYFYTIPQIPHKNHKSYILKPKLWIINHNSPFPWTKKGLDWASSQLCCLLDREGLHCLKSLQRLLIIY